MSLLRRGRGGGSRVETPRTDTQKELQWTAKHRQTVGGGVVRHVAHLQPSTGPT